MPFAWKGTVLYSLSPTDLQVYKDAYVVCDSGICQGVFSKLPPCYEHIPVHDFGNALILPGMSDLHLHAPQYAFRGVWMDQEVVDWLNTYTFPHESKYSDLQYAERAYRIFAEDLKNSLTTRACIFGTIHSESTRLLMELLDKTGIKTFAGRVSTDRNAPDCLIEESAAASYKSSLNFLNSTLSAYKNCKPILTPRCTFFCSDQMMEDTRRLMLEYGLPLQSHLSENPRRLKQLKKLYPNETCDGEAYDRFGLFGTDCPVVMAHCVHSPEQEINLMAKPNLYVAHCPESNLNLSSGIAPVRRIMSAGIKTGLGSDIAAGARLSMLYIMGLAIQVSKMYWRYVDTQCAPLTVEEVFYMATLGGGGFFGQVGSFIPGYDFDAVALSDDAIRSPIEFTPKERLERMLYLHENARLLAKCVAGQEIPLSI